MMDTNALQRGETRALLWWLTRLRLLRTMFNATKLPTATIPRHCLIRAGQCRLLNCGIIITGNIARKPNNCARRPLSASDS